MFDALGQNVNVNVSVIIVDSLAYNRKASNALCTLVKQEKRFHVCNEVCPLSKVKRGTDVNSRHIIPLHVVQCKNAMHLSNLCRSQLATKIAKFCCHTLLLLIQQTLSHSLSWWSLVVKYFAPRLLRLGPTAPSADCPGANKCLLSCHLCLTRRDRCRAKVDQHRGRNPILQLLIVSVAATKLD